jgi:hypothetical protein
LSLSGTWLKASGKRRLRVVWTMAEDTDTPQTVPRERMR